MVEVSNKTRAALYEAADIFKPRDYNSELQWLALCALSVLLPLALPICMHTFDVLTWTVAELRWLKRGFIVCFEVLLLYLAAMNYQHRAECAATNKNENYPVVTYDWNTCLTAFAGLGVLVWFGLLGQVVYAFIEDTKKVLDTIAGLFCQLIAVVPFTDPTITQMALGCGKSIIVHGLFWTAMRTPDVMCAFTLFSIAVRRCMSAVHTLAIATGIFFCVCIASKIEAKLGLGYTQQTRNFFGIASGTPTGQQVAHTVQYIMPALAFNPPAATGQTPSKQNIANIAKIATKKSHAVAWPGGRKNKGPIWTHFHNNCLVNGIDPDKKEIEVRIKAAGVSTSGKDLEDAIYLYAMQELVSLGLL